MTPLEEARFILATPHCHQDEPKLRGIIAGLVGIIDRERQERRELERDHRDSLAVAAAEARHAQNEFGGRDM